MNVRILLAVCLLAGLMAGWPGTGSAQRGGRGGRGGQAPATAREAAPADLTGTWVSVITEDWRWRMVTPARGDFASVPLNATGREAGLAWDPAADRAAGLECRAYGAAALMRAPGRVRISWEDDNTLRIDADAGAQTRILHFGGGAPADFEPTWQGYSVANWEGPVRGSLTPQSALGAVRTGTSPRSLEVVTTGMRPGYLRKNGVPYSGDAVLREFVTAFAGPDGDEWFVVTSVVEDPVYLSEPFVTSSNFKKESGDGGWNPTPCGD